MQTELSVEETNKLRVQLGLKPIPTTATKIDDDDRNNNENEDEIKIIKKDHNKKKNKAAVEDLNDAVIEDGEIFTLKDVDLLNENNNDEPTELVAESDILNSMMNNKRRSKDAKHSMYEDGTNDDDEEEGGGESFKIGDSAVIKLKASESFKEKQRLQKLKDEATRTGRKLIELEDNEDGANEDEDEEDLIIGESDYSKSKSKKDKSKLFKKKKKGKSAKKKNTSTLLDGEDEELDLSKHVNLINGKNEQDESFDTDELALQKLIALKNRNNSSKRENENNGGEDNSRKRFKKNVFTGAILEGDKDTDDSSLVIGGNSEFLSNLKQSIFEKKNNNNNEERKEETGDANAKKPFKIDLKRKEEQHEEANEKAEDEDEEEYEDNFNNAGIGSMLQYLKKNSLLKITEKTKQESAKRELQNRIRDEISSNNDEINESERIKVLQEQYNPDINITYMDDENNELSRREAYKYMSHKFHGQKLSNKKQAKISQKRK